MAPATKYTASHFVSAGIRQRPYSMYTFTPWYTKIFNLFSITSAETTTINLKQSAGSEVRIEDAFHLGKCAEQKRRPILVKLTTTSFNVYLRKW